MAGNGSVSSFSLKHSIFIDTDRRHQAEGAESLCDNIRLNIAVIVLAGPNEAAAAFNCLSYKIVNQTVLVVDACFYELVFVVFLVLLIKDIHEKTVILFQNSVLSGQFERIASCK